MIVSSVNLPVTEPPATTDAGASNASGFGSEFLSVLSMMSGGEQSGDPEPEMAAETGDEDQESAAWLLAFAPAQPAWEPVKNPLVLPESWEDDMAGGSSKTIEAVNAMEEPDSSPAPSRFAEFAFAGRLRMENSLVAEPAPPVSESGEHAQSPRPEVERAASPRHGEERMSAIQAADSNDQPQEDARNDARNGANTLLPFDAAERVTHTRAGDTLYEAAEVARPHPAEVEFEPVEAVRHSSGAAREISMRLPGGGHGGAELRVSEKGGELHLSVRTANAGLADALRQGLDELTAHMDRAGMEAEFWAPRTQAAFAESGSESSTEREAQFGGGGDDGRRDPGRPHRHGHRRSRAGKWMEDVESIEKEFSWR